jgi:hypothetical protein
MMRFMPLRLQAWELFPTAGNELVDVINMNKIRMNMNKNDELRVTAQPLLHLFRESPNFEVPHISRMEVGGESLAAIEKLIQ